MITSTEVKNMLAQSSSKIFNESHPKCLDNYKVQTLTLLPYLDVTAGTRALRHTIVVGCAS